MFYHRLFTPFAALVLFAIPVMAEEKSAATHPEPTQSTDVSQVPEGRYVMDKTHASLIFSASHLGFADYYGRFDDFEGWMVFDTRNVEQSEVKIVIDPASVNTNSDKLEKKMQGEDWFNSEAFPKIVFYSTEVKKTGDTTGKITGELDFLGVKKPVTLDVEWQGGGKNPFSQRYTLGFHATGTIKRSDWGMNVYLPNIGNEVNLIIAVEFQLDEAGDAKNYYGEL